MNRYALLALTLAGCMPSYATVIIEEPTHAKVTILEGVGTPAVQTQVPFSGRFEGATLRTSDGYRLRFELDAANAARFGSSQPIVIYGRLCVGPLTELGKSSALHVRVSDEKLVALVKGDRSEIETFVSDPNKNQELARLILRMVEF
jgi:hypothetical protein